jgi:TRAP-type C4-dicarboxylate transport system substrate-binding protein
MNLNALPSRSRVARVVSAAVLVALVASCGGSPPDRSGQPADPVSLTSADPSGAGAVGGDVLASLVRLSADRAVTVQKPTVQTIGDDAEGDALAALRRGDADLAVLRTDTVATAGATSLSVLTLPLLVESVEQADRVAADPVAEELMKDLSKIGLVGVALVPGGLRHPFGYVEPLLGPDDYKGTVINTRVGGGLDRLMQALGARTNHSVDDERTALAKSGALRGIEVSLQQPKAVTLPAVVTSNVTLYTKFDVVVVRAERWDQMTEGQRNDLRNGVREAGKDAIAARDSEVAALNRWCATKGGSSVVADPDTANQLRAALQPVVDAARADSALAPLIDRVEVLGRGTTTPVGKECGTPADNGTVPASGFEVTPVGPQDVLDGTWRLVVDRQVLVDAGISPQEAGANAGVWTIKVADGVGEVDQPNGPDCTWKFQFDGNRFSLDYAYDGNDACYGLSAGTFELDGDVARFTFDRARDNPVALDNASFASGMQRVG